MVAYPSPVKKPGTQESASVKPHTVNEMASGTARTAFSISENSKGCANVRQVVRRHLGSGAVDERPDVHLGERDLEPDAGVPLDVLLQPLRAPAELGVQVPLDADAVDRHVLVEQLLSEGERGVGLGVACRPRRRCCSRCRRAIRSGRPRRAQRNALAMTPGPRFAIQKSFGLSPRRVGVGQELVADVPLPDAAAVAADLGVDVLLQQARSAGTC